MTAALTQPRLASSALLHLERTDIVFADHSAPHAGFAVTIRNEGDGPATPTVAVIEAAPLGAFVPWTPLTAVPVPALAPGAAHALSFTALRPKARPLGPPDRMPPRQILIAAGFADEPGRSAAIRARQAAPRVDVGPGVLPADLMELLLDRQLYWAGNLNVHVGNKAVERHLAQALRICPGRTNMAWFFVGSGPDAYRFRIDGVGPDWDARLFDMSGRRSLLVDPRKDTPLAEEEWFTVTGTTMFLMALAPPANCGPGSVEVHVTQRSSGATAVVEFSCDPRAAGPGCYVVS